jgi:AcrR family transcriptional regulator
MTDQTPPHEGGPGIRHQIIEAADAHFSRYGYSKTTMVDLAKAIGFSKAYLYKFFDSKQAIGEAICSRYLFGQLGVVLSAIDSANGANEKLRALFRMVAEQNRTQFFADRQLYEIVSHSRSENWSSSVGHIAQLNELLRDIIQEGRLSGEFERKTPLDEVCRGIWLSLLPFTDPVLLQHSLDDIDDGLPAVLGVVLRSLSP